MVCNYVWWQCRHKLPKLMNNLLLLFVDILVAQIVCVVIINLANSKSIKLTIYLVLLYLMLILFWSILKLSSSAKEIYYQNKLYCGKNIVVIQHQIASNLYDIYFLKNTTQNWKYLIVYIYFCTLYKKHV